MTCAGVPLLTDAGCDAIMDYSYFFIFAPKIAAVFLTHRTLFTAEESIFL